MLKRTKYGTGPPIYCDAHPSSLSMESCSTVSLSLSSYSTGWKAPTGVAIMTERVRYGLSGSWCHLFYYFCRSWRLLRRSLVSISPWAREILLICTAFQVTKNRPRTIVGQKREYQPPQSHNQIPPWRCINIYLLGIIWDVGEHGYYIILTTSVVRITDCQTIYFLRSF